MEQTKSSAPCPLEVMRCAEDFIFADAKEKGFKTSVGGEELRKARAAVAELVAAARWAAKHCGVCDGLGYTDISASFCSIPGGVDDCRVCGDLRQALAKFGGEK